MKPWSLRNKSRISYCETIEPPLDNYVYCDNCADFVYEYCSIHGPLLIIPDNKVEDSELLGFIPRAALTIPNIFLHIAASYIPGAGLGVFSSISLPSGVRFGPYCGDITTDVGSNYCWQIYDSNNKRRHIVDGADVSRGSNWMRYVNCSRHYCEQNLIAYQYEGQLYYRTIKLIPRFTELLVFYGGEFASSLHIDLKLYNNPIGASKIRYLTPNSASRQINQEINVDSLPEIDKTDNNNNESYIDIQFHNDTISITSTNESDKDIADEDITYSNNLANKVIESNYYNLANNYNVHEDKDIATNEGIAAETYNLASNYNLTLDNKTNRDIANEDNLQEEVNSLSNIQTNQTKTNLIMMSGLFSCMHCDFKRPYKKLVSKHILTNHKEQCFSCNICNTSFVSQNNLEIHSQSHVQTHSCNKCNFKTTKKYSLNKHLQTHENWYNCSQCDFKCKKNISLQTHIQAHTVQSYSCNQCSYKTTKKYSLNKHLQTHENWYNCSQCDFKCKKNISLQTHIQAHTVQSHSCNQCSYKTTRKYSLNKHLQTHEVQTNSCNKCDYKTTNKRNFNKHLQNHEKWYNCSQCEFKCKAKIILIMHFRTHTNIELFKCNECYYNSPSRKNFREHLMRHKKSMPNLEN